jgi:hypothetical protein
MGGRTMKGLSEYKKLVGALVLALVLLCVGAALQTPDPLSYIVSAGKSDGDAKKLAATAPAHAPASPPVLASERETDDNPIAGTSVASLSATQERPVFSPSRRRLPPVPVPVQALPTVSAPQRPTLSLVGVVAGEGDAFAIFLDEKTKAVIRLKKGESHSGWTLRNVHAREATLERGQESEVLAIVLPAAR